MPTIEIPKSEMDEDLVKKTDQFIHVYKRLLNAPGVNLSSSQRIMIALNILANDQTWKHPPVVEFKDRG